MAAKPTLEQSLSQGKLLFQAGRYEEAAECFKACIRLGAGEEVRAFMAQARRSMAPPAAGRSGVQNSVGPRTLEPFLAARDYPGAFQEAERLFEADRGGAYRLLRDLWLKGGFPGVERQDPRSPWSGYFSSSEAWMRGDDLAALEFLRRSAACERHFWMRYYIAEILLRRLDLFEAARREIEAVIKRCPWLWEARCLRAEILLALGAPGALKGLGGVKVQGRAQAAFLAWRGALGMWTGGGEAALADLDAAESLDNPDALCWRGGARVLSGRLDGAVDDLTRLLAIDSKDPEALVWRAEALRLMGKEAESLSDLDAALGLSANSLWARANRALLRLRRSDLRGAQEDFAQLGPLVVSAAGKHVPAPVDLKSAPLKAALETALRQARGCRRMDTHLNYAWMRAAGIALPRRPAPGSRMLYWMRHMRLPAPAEPPFGPTTVTEKQVAAALRARP